MHCVCIFKREHLSVCSILSKEKAQPMCHILGGVLLTVGMHMLSPKSVLLASMTSLHIIEKQLLKEYESIHSCRTEKR